MLFMSITFIIAQLLHKKDNGYSIPYVSLVRVGLQALGYGIFGNGWSSGSWLCPPIDHWCWDFVQVESEYFKVHPQGLEQLHASVKVFDNTAKLRLSAASLLTAKLLQKVAASHKRSYALGPTTKCVPSEKLVLLVTWFFVVLCFGFCVSLTACWFILEKVLNLSDMFLCCEFGWWN